MRRWVFLCIILICAGARGAVGQNAAEPDAGMGLWIGGGIGGGAAKAGCNVCRSWELAPAAQLRFGGTINEHLLLGIEGNGWVKNDTALGVRDVMLGLGAVLYWYPNPAEVRYFVKAGVGPMYFRASDSDVSEGDAPDPAVTAKAFGGQLGVGYEFAVEPLAFVPFFNITASLGANLYQGDTRLTHVALTLLQIGLAVQLQ